MSYVPPFTVSAEAINLIAEISALVEHYAIRLAQSDSLQLRKANRIKTIHSSLAIEGNELTEGQVQDILEGRNVIAPIRQIQEVKNANATYKLYHQLNPFSTKDLLKAHGVMMQTLINDAGRFRSGGVGVFEGERCVHLAPPANRVPMLIGELFDWLKKSKDHLLIRSCVFHFEFEFIHPFSDGNGRMGRLWQSLILGKLHPVFEHLPVENMVYTNQQEYYESIQTATNEGQAGPFIDYMLKEIYYTLKAHQGKPLSVVPGNIPDKVPNNIPNNIPNKLIKQHPDITPMAWSVLSCIIESPNATSEAIGTTLGISGRMVRTYISTLKELNIIERVGSNKAGYWKLLTAKEDEP